MHRLRTGLFVALAGASTIAGAAAVPASAEPAPAGTTAYGLTTDDRIVTIDTAAADLVTRSVAVDVPGELIGIDRRPFTGQLYTIAKTSDTTGVLYTVDPTTGAATKVADLLPQTTCAGQAILDGDDFGFDFNPMADALRVVADNGRNLRILPEGRTAGGVPGTTNCDGTLNYGGATAVGITAAAYVNNVANATSTALLDLDTVRDDLVLQAPPNSGTLSKQADLDQPTGPVAGFDIRTADGVDTGYVALSKANGGTKLYGIDLATGETTAIGSVGAKNALKGLAL